MIKKIKNQPSGSITQDTFRLIRSILMLFPLLGFHDILGTSRQYKQVSKQVNKCRQYF